MRERARCSASEASRACEEFFVVSFWISGHPFPSCRGPPAALKSSHSRDRVAWNCSVALFRAEASSELLLMTIYKHRSMKKGSGEYLEVEALLPQHTAHRWIPVSEPIPTVCALPW